MGAVRDELRQDPSRDPAFRFITVVAVAGIPVLVALALFLFVIGRTRGGWTVLAVTLLQTAMVGGGFWLRRES